MNIKVGICPDSWGVWFPEDTKQRGLTAVGQAIDEFALEDPAQWPLYDGYAIVEQDMYPAPFDKPLPIARRTRGYLRQVGIG